MPLKIRLATVQLTATNVATGRRHLEDRGNFTGWSSGLLDGWVTSELRRRGTALEGSRGKRVQTFH